jgi:ribosomal protein S18 acetylase RimI-like enzyme
LASEELQAAAEIFQIAFSDEHASRYREGARPNSFVDVWQFVREIAPNGFLAAREDGILVGYAIFVPSLSRVQREAFLRGAIVRWALASFRGGFALRISALWRVLLNKLLFVTHSRRFRTQGDAQLLNIAVHPNAQGRGIATALIRAGLKTMREARVPEVRLEVRPWNRQAVSLYRRTGWTEAGRTRDLEGEWLVMTAKP